MSTHIQLSTVLSIPAEPSWSAEEIFNRLRPVDVIAVDEGQFFDPELIETALTLSEKHRVIIAGLDTDFRGLPFGPMGGLLAAADEDVHLKAVCAVCGKPATRTQRLTNGKPSRRDEPTILVGSDSIYQARCRSCHVVF